MPLLNIAPTKSNLLTLRRQLAFAEEGYDLLEQKRQILILELMRRLDRAVEAEQRVTETLARAFAALRNATLDSGSLGVDRASLAIRMNHQLQMTTQRLMGLRVPRITAQISPPAAFFGVGGTGASTEIAMRQFLVALALLPELAELQNAVMRLAGELQKTQRRCNALTRIFIPNYRQTIGYIVGVLEERDREALAIMKIIRGRFAAAREEEATAAMPCHAVVSEQ